MFVSIAGNFINCDEIEFILNYSTKFAKDYYQLKKEEGKLANLTKNKEKKALFSSNPDCFWHRRSILER